MTKANILRRTSWVAVLATVFLSACAVKSPAPEPAKPVTATKPVHPACQPAAAGDDLAGNWLSKHRQKGVVGELRTLFTLQTEGT